MELGPTRALPRASPLTQDQLPFPHAHVERELRLLEVRHPAGQLQAGLRLFSQSGEADRQDRRYPEIAASVWPLDSFMACLAADQSPAIHSYLRSA